jgi:carbonic anhydrase
LQILGETLRSMAADKPLDPVLCLHQEMKMITANDALTRLQEGNKRFVSGVRSIDTLVKQMQIETYAEGQTPFAIILGCSDSRVPAEIVFDQGLGDLFVIRVAGNIVAPSQIGSVELATELFGTPLVVVLGHSMCGAVMATLDDLENQSEARSSNVLSIVNRIRPVVEPLFRTELRKHPEQLLDASIRANILAACNHLRHGSQQLEHLIQKGALTIVGAEYSLKTGVVEFFDGV